MVNRYVWQVGRGVKALVYGSEGVFPRGVRVPDSERKYLWDALCLPPTRRRPEIGGAEPEIRRSPNQKRSITLQTPKGER